MKTIAERREALGLTQTKLAEMVGVHRTTIWAAEKNRDVVARRTLAAIDRALGEAEHSVSPEAELATLASIVEEMEGLHSTAQRRTLAYLNDRYGGAS